MLISNNSSAIAIAWQQAAASPLPDSDPQCSKQLTETQCLSENNTDTEHCTVTRDPCDVRGAAVLQLGVRPRAAGGRHHHRRGGAAADAGGHRAQRRQVRLALHRGGVQRSVPGSRCVFR